MTTRLYHGAEVAHHLLIPGPADHKYTRGVVGIVAGSTTYPGAGVLACAGAASAGTGMIRLDAPERVQNLALARDPGIVTVGGRIQAGIVGPGMDADTEQQVRDLAGFCLASKLPVVIDAGALALLPDLLGGGHANTAVLTPHAGEAAHLLTLMGRPTTREQVESAPADTAEALASLTGAIVLVKGSATVIAQTGHDTITLPTGSAWTGVAGAGDVLAGIIGAVLAQWKARREKPDLEATRPMRGPASSSSTETPLCQAVAAAAWIHAAAARQAAERHGPYGAPIRAIDIADTAPSIIGGILGQ